MLHVRVLNCRNRRVGAEADVFVDATLNWHETWNDIFRLVPAVEFWRAQFFRVEHAGVYAHANNAYVSPGVLSPQRSNPKMVATQPPLCLASDCHRALSGIDAISHRVHVLGLAAQGIHRKIASSCLCVKLYRTHSALYPVN